ncbi:hypothetical protein BDZ91DRAFT_783006 [Kalaharituber pfeilii]|nr:hypothetical protein BDZ91DRAFT_783006 [Kalaharituber pfeilii]
MPSTARHSQPLGPDMPLKPAHCSQFLHPQARIYPPNQFTTTLNTLSQSQIQLLKYWQLCGRLVERTKMRKCTRIRNAHMRRKRYAVTLCVYHLHYKLKVGKNYHLDESWIEIILLLDYDSWRSSVDGPNPSTATDRLTTNILEVNGGRSTACGKGGKWQARGQGSGKRGRTRAAKDTDNKIVVKSIALSGATDSRPPPPPPSTLEEVIQQMQQLQQLVSGLANRAER